MGEGGAPVRLGVLAAAGAGLRAWPRTERLPKALFEVGGATLLERNLRLLRDEVGVERVLVLVGHRADDLRAFVGDGGRFGLAVECVEVPRPAEGLARGIATLAARIEEPFALLLADELYVDSGHARLRELSGPYEAVLGILPGADRETLAKNYAVRRDGERVLGLTEKPAVTGRPPEPLPGACGVGTFLLRPSIFDAIERTDPNPRTGRVELIDALDLLAREARPERPVRALELAGEYVNVNREEDLQRADSLLRARRLADARISVVIPAWNEAESIGAVVDAFLPHAFEVIVADNESEDGTAERARERGARVSSRPLAGYGAALRHGFELAKGDVLVAVEADHSFRAEDLGKLLAYLKDADLVVGTRTTRELVEQGANMRGLVRWANVAFGKGLELLWWGQEPRFTDVGCTYRAIWRDAYERIRPRLSADGPEFAPEMVVEVLRARRRVIEVPVSYHRRLGGSSKHSGDLRALARTAWRMTRLILARRFAR